MMMKPKREEEDIILIVSHCGASFKHQVETIRFDHTSDDLSHVGRGFLEQVQTGPPRFSGEGPQRGS